MLRSVTCRLVRIPLPGSVASSAVEPGVSRQDTYKRTPVLHIVDNSHRHLADLHCCVACALAMLETGGLPASCTACSACLAIGDRQCKHVQHKVNEAGWKVCQLTTQGITGKERCWAQL